MSDKERDELAMELFIVDNHKQSREQSVVDWDWFTTTPKFGVRVENYKTTADGLIAAGYRKPRTITTAEELDALPVGQKVAGGICVFQKLRARGHEGAEEAVWLNLSRDHINGIYGILPATVLCEPAS